MNVVACDLETFWSTEHSLSKMNPIDYVMHPETELISCSIKIDDDPVMCAFGAANIRTLLNGVNWGQAYLVGHNMSGFDALVLAWRLGISPRFWGCTLAMARPLHAKTTGLSLKALVEHYGIGKKDNTALVNTRGKHLADFTVPELRAMAEYNKADTWQCYELFKRLRPHYSARELWHLDSKIRGVVEPKFVLDVPLLEDALERERQAKRESILALAQLLGPQVLAGTGGGPVSEDYVIERVRATLASAPMFSKVLEARGVPTPMKPSPTNPDKMVPALAKTDEAFQELREHPDELVSAAVEARLSIKSTLAETRMQAFLNVAKVTGGRWPVTVNYCGADTTGRASGWHYNPLNLPRINPDRPRPADALRGSLTAPEGHLVVVADLSGIEMRFNHFLWKVPYSTQLWRDDPEADIYKPTGARLMGVELDQVTKAIRQAGKVVQLGCGFGCGPARFIDVARIMGGLTLTLDESEMYVYGWRDMHPEITQGWRTCHTALSWIFEGMERPIDPHGIFWTCAEGIRLPSGRLIRYPALRNEDGEWVYGTGRHKTRIYAGKVDENIVQAGARDVVYDVAYDVFKETGYRPALEVYDELVYVVPEKDAQPLLDTLQARMRKKVEWFPDLVTWSEGNIGMRYSDAK